MPRIRVVPEYISDLRDQLASLEERRARIVRDDGHVNVEDLDALELIEDRIDAVREQLRQRTCN